MAERSGSHRGKAAKPLSSSQLFSSPVPPLSSLFPPTYTVEHFKSSIKNYFEPNKNDSDTTLVSVIIPTYNEKDNLPILLYLFHDKIANLNGYAFEFVICDDNSPDKTADIVKSFAKIFPEIEMTLLKRPGKLGLGTAYCDAFKLARGDFLVIMDADLSHHPNHLPRMLQLQKENNADVVTGSRYIRGGGVCGWDFRRILISRCANYLAKVLLNPKASDLTGSYRLYRRRAFETLISQVESKGFCIQMELIVRAQHNKFKIVECPIVFVDRLYGNSKLGSGEIIQYLKTVYLLFWTF